MRNNSRPLLIFDSRGSSERSTASLLGKQKAIFKGHETDLQARDVVLTFIPQVHDPAAKVQGSWADLRRQFRVDDRQFTVVLVGKDGGEKFRSDVPVTIEKLNALIDAMPMRQQEVRNGHHAE